jgi:hypothetical protein
MGSLWMLFEGAMIDGARSDGACGGDEDAGCFVGIVRKGVSIDSDLSCLSQSNNVMYKLK